MVTNRLSNACHILPKTMRLLLAVSDAADKGARTVVVFIRWRTGRGLILVFTYNSALQNTAFARAAQRGLAFLAYAMV